MAGSTIDLDEIAMPEILDPRKVKGLHSGLCSRNVLRALADLVNGYPDPDATVQARRGVRISFGNHRRTVCAFPKRARTG
jgi:hypothetical protein